MYIVKAPLWLKSIYPGFTWNMDRRQKTVYLTFDDGPTPGITSWVLDLLREKDIKATFFLVGNNIEKYPDTYQRILREGHSVGNHTYHHLNGWKCDKETYVKDVMDCEGLTGTRLFRPPYGRIRRSQSRFLRKLGFRIIMWDILSADYDSGNSPEQCIHNVTSNVGNGSVIVFHDSRKAWRNLRGSLPTVIHTLREKGYSFERL